MSTTRSEQNNPLGYAPIPGLIFKFAVPSIISMLVTAAYNITDQIFIGHQVGILGNAATNVAFPLVFFTNAMAQLVGVGTAANFNICQGGKETESAKKYIGTGLFMGAVIGILLGIFVFALRVPIIHLCGATETVFPYACDYLSITALGMPFLMFSSCTVMMIRADGSPTWSMLSVVSGAVLNIALDAFFMLGLGMGIKGAALATVIGQVLSFLLCIIYFFRFKAFPITKDMLKMRSYEGGRIARLGLSNFFNQTVMMIVNIVLNNVLKNYGASTIYGSDIPLAVSGIVSKINAILISFAVGLSHGCQPVFSYNMGAKNYKRVKETYRDAFFIELTFGITAFTLFQLFPGQITGIFGSGNALYYEFARRFLTTYLFFVFLYCLQPLTVNYFTAVGNVKYGIFLSLSRQGLVLLPLLLILPAFMGLDGILYAGPASDLAAFVLAMAAVYKNFREMPA